ncbi:MAG: PG0541 family transporter-associated protein [Verrucomicrobiota bacterium]
MKMIMIAYNEAIDMEVMEALAECRLKNYTKVTGVYGRGTTSGTHLGTDIWPGRNNVLYVAGGDEDVSHILGCIRCLRERYGREGIKAFVIPLEDVT